MKLIHASRAGLGRTLRLAVVSIFFLAGCSPSLPTNPSPSVQTPPTARSEAPTSSAPPIDTSSWIAFESKQHGITIKHPPGWKVIPAEHDWTLEKDVNDFGGAGSNVFWAPPGDLYVAAWSTSVEDTPETLEGVAAWVKRYCDLQSPPCRSVADAAIPLCNGSQCHPGLLVREGNGYIEAFFRHEGHMIVVSLGRPEGHHTVEKYGGAWRLLEGFLRGMDVCPAQPDNTSPGCP